jgi:flagellar protein FliO/FliZ
MTGDTIGLLLRLVVSLVAVIGLMWLAARVLRGSVTGGGNGVMEVLARQSLGRSSSVAVVRIADKAVVVGITESKVSFLADADLAAIEAAQGAADAERSVRSPVDTAGTDVRTGVSGRAMRPGTGSGLEGSIVSPATWKQAVNVLRDRTARKG